MTKKELETALIECQKVRDSWCAEYVKMRNRHRRLWLKHRPLPYPYDGYECLRVDA